MYCLFMATMVMGRLLIVSSYIALYPRLPTPAFQTVAVLQQSDRDITKFYLSDPYHNKSVPSGLESSEINLLTL